MNGLIGHADTKNITKINIFVDHFDTIEQVLINDTYIFSIYIRNCELDLL